MSTQQSPRRSRTARERRGLMIYSSILIAVVLGFSTVISLRGGVLSVWEFFVITAAGIAIGLLVFTVRSAPARWTLIAVLVGVAITLRISVLPGAVAPWVLAAIGGAFLARDEWPWRRTAEERQRAQHPLPLASIRPWRAAGLTASLTEIPVGRRGETETGVRLVAGDVTARVRVDELHRLVSGRSGIAESIDSDDTETSGRTIYLTRVDTASPDSTVGEALAGLPGDALAFLPITDPMPSAPAAMLTGSDLASFQRWALAIPEP
jgi:hypothetical protein